MIRKKVSQNPRKQRRADEGSGIPWRYCLLTLVCGAVLVSGFFLAARQHFSAIDFGIKNSKLRQQIENLESEKRRFLLAKEIAMSPLEIKKAAQKLGFRDMTANNIEVYQAIGDAKDSLKNSLLKKPEQSFLDSVTTAKKEVVKTVKILDKNDVKSDAKVAAKSDVKPLIVKDAPKKDAAKKDAPKATVAKK